MFAAIIAAIAVAIAASGTPIQEDLSHKAIDLVQQVCKEKNGAPSMEKSAVGGVTQLTANCYFDGQPTSFTAYLRDGSYVINLRGREMNKLFPAPINTCPGQITKLAHHENVTIQHCEFDGQTALMTVVEGDGTLDIYTRK